MMEGFTWRTSASLLASRPFCRMDGHRQTRAGTQGHHHLGLDRMTRDQAQLIALSHGREDQLGFHHGKVVAYAHARSSPKGEVGIGRTSSRALWREALRIGALLCFLFRGTYCPG